MGDKSPPEIHLPNKQSKQEAVKIVDEESYDDIRAAVQLIPKLESKPASESKEKNFKKTIKSPEIRSPRPGEAKLDFKKVIGYNSRTRNNLVWAYEQGWIAYTSGKKVVQVMLRDNNKHRVFEADSNALSVLTASPDYNILASASETSVDNLSAIFLWDVSSKRALRTLSIHEKGVSDLRFSGNGKFLLSLGVWDEPIIVIWDVSSGRLVSTALVENPCISAM